MLNASDGVQRALARLRPATSHRSTKVLTLQRRSVAIARAVRSMVPSSTPVSGHSPARTEPVRTKPAHADTARRNTRRSKAGIDRGLPPAHVHIRRDADAGFLPNTRTGLAPRSASAHALPARKPAAATSDGSLIGRLGAERVVPAFAVAILFVATAVSGGPSLASNGSVGGTTSDGPAARLAIGGVDSATSGPQGGVDASPVDAIAGVILGNGAGILANAIDPSRRVAPDDRTARVAGSYLADSTILKPVAVDTTVSDGKNVMRSYRVLAGDTLSGIAAKFRVSMMTVWWANHLKAKTDLHVGQTLTIPPVSGIVVTVGPTDTLDSLAAAYGIGAAEIVSVNKLNDPNLVIGQTLTIPGALGDSIVAPAPTPRPKPPTVKPSNGGHKTTPRPPAAYTGGRFAWPVDGGYISQYFHYGHYAIDIAADPGTGVKAAAAGTVIFAGWKDNGGGYQVWISHGSGLFTTYNHMSAVSVGSGQSVGRGQHVGRVGMTGNASGPHLHFEVWKGPVWDGGTRVNPLAYL